MYTNSLDKNLVAAFVGFENKKKYNDLTYV